MKVGKLEVEITADDTKLRQGLKRTDTQLKATSEKMNGMQAAATKGAKGLGHVGRSAGMASIQLQQFIGQVSGGVNPMIALSQQGADLGFVLGAPLLGSVVGISASLGTMLLPSLFDSKSAMEDLEAASELLNKSIRQTDFGVFELSDAIKNLSKQGGKALEAELVAGMIKAEKVVKASTDGVIESFGELKGVGFGLFDVTGIDDYVEALNNTKKSTSINIRAQEGFIQVSQELGEQFGLTGEEARSTGQRIIEMLAKAQKSPTPEALNQLQETLAGLITSTGNASKEAILLTSKIQEMTSEGIAAGEMAKFLQENIDNLQSNDGEIIDTKAVETAKSLVEELTIAREELINGESAANRLALALSLGASSFSELPEDIKRSVVELEAIEQKQKQMQQAERDAIKLKSEAEREAKKQALEQEMKNRKILADYDKLVSGGMGEQSELDKIQADFEAKRELLIQHSALLHQDEMLDAQQRKAINQQLQDELTIIEEDAARQRAAIADAEEKSKVNAIGNAFNRASSLMNTGSRKLFEIGKKAAKASALINTYKAIQTARASAPPPFNYALAAAEAVAGAVNVRQINAQQFGGGGSAVSFSGGVPAVNTQQAGQQAQPQRNVSINLQGSNFSADQVRALIGEINEQIGDGVMVI